MNALDYYKKDGVRVEIYPDEDCTNPRDWDENFCTMYAWCKDRTGGDTHDFRTVGHWLWEEVATEVGDVLPYDILRDYLPADEDQWTEELISMARDSAAGLLLENDERLINIAIRIFLAKKGVAMPYLAGDQEFRTINQANFDIGYYDGIAFASFEKIREIYGTVDPTTIEKAKEAIDLEVEEYGEWANGHCYRYVVKVEGKIVDSCGGYIGFDAVEKKAKLALDSYAKDNVAARAAIAAYGYA